MKRFTIFLTVFFFSISLFAQQQFSKVKVMANDAQLQQLASIGIDVSEGILKKGEYLICDFSEQDIAQFSELGLNYEILIEDVAKYYADRNIGLSNNPADYKDAGDYAVPENFEFGSMSGHATYAEIVAHLDNMVNLFPNLITVKESIGQSIEGRDLWMVRISDNPNVNETEPEVLYTSLTHAREPAGVMQMLFYMYYLLENYDNDPFIQTLVNNTEMYFVPVVNPDGYVYNQTTNPNGGGMWRKNRRNNGGSYGVDLNRNYGFMWGYDNSGSSPYPEDETYRGTAPFSEPETAAIRDFCESHEFKGALNYHTYANLLLYAWGWSPDPCEDNDLYHAYAQLMTQDNNYTFGPGNTTIYNTNGGSDDWMYGEQTTKGKILAYTPELGGDNDGFWCPQNRIIPIAQENMIQNLLLAAFAGSYAVVEDLTPTITNQLSVDFNFEITRLGLSEGTYTVSLTPIGNEVISTGDPVVYTDLDIMVSETGTISYVLDPATENGTVFQLLLSIDNGNYIISDTLTKIYGEAMAIFEDDCNTLGNWTSTYWNVTSEQYHSAPQSITDSPGGEYPNNANRVITLNSPIEMSNAVYAELSFWARWEIEAGYDYVQVLISIDNGTNWIPLSGNYSVLGTEYQAEGQPLYDGFQTTWVKEEINISDYIGNPIKFRFKLKADQGVTADGFYFDDLSVMVINESTTGLDNQSIINHNLVSEPFPNPANHSVQFNFNLPENCQVPYLRIYNAAGQQIYSERLQYEQSNLNISVEDWTPGLYYYKLEGENLQSVSRKLMIL